MANIENYCLLQIGLLLVQVVCFWFGLLDGIANINDPTARSDKNICHPTDREIKLKTPLYLRQFPCEREMGEIIRNNIGWIKVKWADLLFCVLIRVSPHGNGRVPMYHCALQMVAWNLHCDISTTTRKCTQFNGPLLAMGTLLITILFTCQKLVHCDRFYPIACQQNECRQMELQMGLNGSSLESIRIGLNWLSD